MKKSTEASAKINLFLKVGEKRGDGYHEIESVMQTVTLHDDVTLELEDCEKNEIVLTSSDLTLPTDRRNIAYKCAEKYLELTQTQGKRVSIHIEKRIPKCGGLAGGSSDGAAVLRLMNDMLSLMSEDELCAVGAGVGADIPFCIVGGTCICRGIGEIIEKIDVPEMKYGVLIAETGEEVSTPEAYSLLDISKTDENAEPDQVISSLRRGIIPMSSYNSFERVILPIRPGAAEIKRLMYSYGADLSMMSGSGPSVFGLFYDEDKLNSVKAQLSERGIVSHKCKARK